MASSTPKPNGSINVAGAKGVKFYNDHLFARIRAKYNVGEDILRTENFDFDDITSGGGKGGDPMARTKCKRYFVKEMSDGDHQSLLNIMEDYIEHMDETDSLIARFVMHFNVPKEKNLQKAGKNYIVMNSWSPNVPSSEIEYLLDLKGCCDDKVMMKGGKTVKGVHKRFYQPHLFCGTCCWSKERKEYYDGKKTAFNFGFQMKLQEEQRNLVLRQLDSDVAFLQRNGLMDYSLIVTIVEKSTNDFESILPFAHNQPHVVKHRGDDGYSTNYRAYYFGIIDFLQDWGMGKKIAHCIKCTFAPKPISTIEPISYGNQFLQHFKRNIEIGADHELRPHPSHADSEDTGDGQAITSFGMGDDVPKSPASSVAEHDRLPTVVDLVMISEV